MNMNKLDETARSLQRYKLSSEANCSDEKHIEHVKLISSHLIRKLHVDKFRTVLIAEEQSVAELGGCLFAAR